MFNFEYVTKGNFMEIPYHPYIILIAGGWGSGKTNTSLNLRNHKPDIDKIYLYSNDPYVESINY